MIVASEKNSSYPLFPYVLKPVGFGLLMVSIFSAYLYFYGGRPEFFEVPVFAVLTAYFETRWFVVAQTNLLDEIAVVCGILGFLFVLFSKEKSENLETAAARFRALLFATYISAFTFVFLYLIIFGWPILLVGAFIMVLFLVSFLVSFKTFKNRIEGRDTEKLKSVRS